MLTASNPSPFYQVGGSLPANASTYVRRQADEALFQGLRRGQFCYVFNARQMGKSSLRVQTTKALQAVGVRCAVIDITNIGTRDVTPEQWYASIAGLLKSAFRLDVNLLSWWRDRSHLSVVNRLSEFIDTVLLVQVVEPIVIFIDEIDSVLNLAFSTDDFFALIRACYNRRAEQPNYQRLTFALFGVATPADLISDTTRTPFNIGQAIELRGFQLSESAPLLAGLAEVFSDPESALHQILYWTGGQPFLTQKLCQLAVQEGRGAGGLLSRGALEQGGRGAEGQRGRGAEGQGNSLTQNSVLAGFAVNSSAANTDLSAKPAPTSENSPSPQSPVPSPQSPTQNFIDRLVQTYILHNWESFDEPEHLKTIRDRLLYCEQKAGRLLGLYQQILLRASGGDEAGILVDDSPEQMDLILTGLVEKRSGLLQIKNPIYQQVFNFDWVSQQLTNLRPYFQSINAWIVSGYQDESRLLRGQALRDALSWANNKSLSDLDYRFLAASQECDRHESQRILEAERLKEVETRLQLEQQRSTEQRRNLRRQRILLGIVSLVLFVAIFLGSFAYHLYQQTAISELRAIALSSEALFASHKEFDALLQGIKAKKRLQSLSQIDQSLKAQVDAALWRAILKIQEINRLDGHTAAVLAVDYSPDGQEIATAGVDGTIKLWRPDGVLLKSWKGHNAVVRSVKFSPDGTLLATGGDDKTIKLWRRNGTLLKSIKSQTSGVWSLDFSPDSSTLAACGTDSSVELWSREGQWLKTLPGKTSGMRVVAFSPDGQSIAAGNTDTTAIVWNRDGTLHQILEGHKTGVQAIAYSPNGSTLISGSSDGEIKLWNRQGTLIKTIPGHDTGISSLDFSPDGKMFASASRDKSIKLWKSDGTLLTTLRGHDAAVWGVAFSPDSRELASAGAENRVILWKSESVFQRMIYGVTDITLKLLFSKDGQLIATAGNEKTLKLWQLDGTPLRVIKAHEAAAGRIDFSPDGNTLASVSEDKTLKLWQLNGSLLRVFPKANAALVSVTWHPQGQQIAASSADGNVWLWNVDGTVQKVLQGHTAPIWDVQYSPDGQLLASASNDTTVRLWKANGTPFKTLKGHSAAVWKVAFSPDGKLLASSSGDTTIKLWTREGILVKTLTGHKAGVWGIAFSPDGSLIATASIDETVKLWKRDGTLLTTLEGHQSGVRAVAFHPYLPILASAGDDQTIIIWNLQQILNLDPLSYACNWVQNYLKNNIGAEQRNLCTN